MPNKRNFLNEIKTLDDIEEVENEIIKTGKNIINISHWNPSMFFYSQFPDKKVQFGGLPEFHNYVYSYYLDEQTKSSVKEKLGDLSDFRECLITPSGTISIQCLLDFAKNHLNIRNLVIINPSYFSVHHACRRLKIPTQELDLNRDRNESNEAFLLNRSKLAGLLTNLKRSKSNYGLWVTNPIYSAGIAYTKEDIEFLKNLLKSHPHLYIFADESFSFSSCELLRDFYSMPNFFSIHDPWKQLCLNGYKFSVISYNRTYQKHFEEWADILYGSLPSSSTLGISLFISPFFDEYKQIANDFYQKRLKELDERYGKQLSFTFDRNAHGPYTSCYFSAKNFNLLSSANRFRPLISQTGLSLIPNERNRFPSKLGFSFRINLAKYDGDTFWENFDKLWKYIDNL
ncbi:MAG: aminotransferase class I/II-fold pyridoxal phosphate-dependent enzyme [Oscillibacter sp.]|nr:aminotransferase class I/II-fold pyridoxal phosphate-dependent enzyme [Oscillibacter sp.]